MEKFKVGDWVKHRHGYTGIVHQIVSADTIALKRDDGISGGHIKGCYTVAPYNLELISDFSIENE